MDGVRYRRLRWIFLVFAVALALLGWRLGDIQIRHHGAYALAKLSQNTVEVSLEPVPRGQILDRNLYDLTGRQVVFRIVVIPQLIEKPDEVAAGLAEIMSVETSEIREHLDTAGILPFPVSRTQKVDIITRGWAGVGVLPVTLRYGERPLAVHTVGHLGPYSPGMDKDLEAPGGTKYEANELVGKSGIERLYEAELRGLSPRAAVRAFLDARGRPLSGLGLVVEAGTADDGRHDVRLTLDLRLQQIVEEIMDRKIASGAVVVMDIATGDILALASRPDYHPGRVGAYLDSGVADVFINQALALFQPGSIFKIAVAAAVLEENLVAPESTFVCTGHRDELVPCWLAGGHGELNFAEAFAESCNPVFARLALQLGSRKLVEYAVRFRLDQQALIGFDAAPDPRQDFGLIERPFNLANAGVGQGPVLLTPVQITALVAAIGREGVYVQPRLVSEVRYRNRAVRAFEPGTPERIMSLETARKLAEMMALVTSGGRGSQALVPGWGSAGKTGTAQGPYGGNNTWFSGFVPAPEPRYAVTVLVRNGASGGETAAPIFRAIAERIVAERS